MRGIVGASAKSPCGSVIVERGTKEAGIKMAVVVEWEDVLDVTACLKEGDDEGGGRGWVLLEELEGDVLEDFVWEIAERRGLEEHFEGV
jgi:hypothetical protein